LNPVFLIEGSQFQQRENKNKNNKMAEEEAGGDTGNNNVYMMHKQYAWVPARLLSIEGAKGKEMGKLNVPQYADEASILTDNGAGAISWEEKTVPLKGYPGGTFPMQNTNADDKLEEVADMCDLPFLHEVR
jgi:hypothetical protein